MNKETCPYRMKIPIAQAFPEELREFTGQVMTRYPICTHENAPFRPAPWGKDPYYCDVAVENGLCPLAVSRDESKRDKWEAVKV